MPEDISIAEGEKLLKGLKLPPQPEALVKFLEEANRPSPNHARLAAVIQEDVAMTAGLLKAVNSPMFGLRSKIGSIPQAIALLGLRSVRSLVMALSVRGVFKIDDPVFLDSFWNESTLRASVSARIAKAAPGQDPDTCYMLGLLADCAVPAMIKRFPEYKNFYTDDRHRAEQNITAAEHKMFGTDHATVGYLLAKAWRFPDDISKAIRSHHEIPDDLPSMPGPVMVLKAAEHVVRSARELPDEFEWAALACEMHSLLEVDASLWEQLRSQAA